jgi:hypothetical protein
LKGPNFFLVGAAKSGTTALYSALRNHDDVFLPAVKEPHVYAYLADPATARHLYPDEATARRYYAQLYEPVLDETAIGDASSTNLVVEGAAAAIARDTASARIVAILRHPVDRAFSHYCHFFVAGGEDLPDFAEAVRQEVSRQAAGWPFTYRYLGWSHYRAQLQPFFDLFGRDRVLVHLHDDLCADADAVIRTTLEFLGVDDGGPIPALGRHNEIRPATLRSSAASSRLLRRVAPSSLRRLLGAQATPGPGRPALDAGLRAELTEQLRDEILALEDLLRRDLSLWRR